jgi:hypothetical protein
LRKPVFTGSAIVASFLSRQHTAESVNNIAIIPINDVAVGGLQLGAIARGPGAAP